MTTPSPAPKWRPRSSSLGAYLLCDYRAALDQAAALGQTEKPSGCESSGYAELGTLIHESTQKALNCVWPRHVDPMQPTVRATAAKLFHGDEHRLDAAVVAATAVAVKAMPPAPDGKRWLAETSVKLGGKLTGHIDFLSQDRTVIVDLKTTARKPDHNRMKGDHLIQLMAYAIMVPTVTTGYILYVDSTKAAWSMLIPVDLASPELTEYKAQVLDYIKYLNSPKLARRCIPRPGSHCQSTFCPWVSVCRDRLIPPAGSPQDATPMVAPASTGDFPV